MSWGNIHTTQGVELAACKVELFMVGNLAFYSMVLGKEHMSPHWCWRCNMIKKIWTEEVDGPRTGTKWTVDSVKEHLRQLEAGILNKKQPRNVRGILTAILFDSIEFINILVPSLHNNELFVNEPIKAFMQWIHHRIEQLPLALIDARLEVINLVIEEEVATEALAEAMAPILALKDEVSALRPTKVRNEDRYIFRDDQRKVDWEEANACYTEAKERQAECRKNLQVIGQKVKTTEANVKAIAKKKEHGALSQAVRQQIEDLLQQIYRIVRSSYHGEDFEGNHCRKFIRNANSVMDSIQGLLLAIPEVDRTGGCDNAEIQRYCGAFKRLFQHFDALVHYCQQPFGTLTDNDMIDVRRLIFVLDRLWRRMFANVPPKAHAWWHLVDDLERLRGLKCHSESKIEMAHQVGKRIDLLFRAVNDMEKKIACSFRYQHTMLKASMGIIQDTVKAARSKKRTVADREDEDNDHHGQIMLLLGLPEIVDEFPSLQQLAVADRKFELDVEAVAIDLEEEAAIVNHADDNSNNAK